MSTDRDVTRIVRSWLHEDAHEDADRILSIVLDEIDTTPQRRAGWLARRLPSMSNSTRIVLAAAVVVVIAIAGVGLLSRGPNVGGPSPTATRLPTPTATPMPNSLVPPRGALDLGRHRLILGGVPLTFQVPSAGWSSNGEFGIEKGTEGSNKYAAFIFWLHSAADNVYSDPCAKVLLRPAPARTASALASAVAGIPGLEVVSGPSAVTVGGRPAQHVVVKVRSDIACAPNDFYLWEDLDTPGDARYATDVGMTIYTWIIEADSNGTLVWIDGETLTSSGPQAEQEVNQIVDSILFE
jgi:hypothetical protein